MVDDHDTVHVASHVLFPLCAMPVIGQPFPAVHRVLEFRLSFVEGRPYFFFTLSGGSEDDVLVSHLSPDMTEAFADVRALVAWLMEAEDVEAALGDLAAETVLRNWSPTASH